MKERLALEYIPTFVREHRCLLSAGSQVWVSWLLRGLLIQGLKQVVIKEYQEEILN